MQDSFECVPPQSGAGDDLLESIGAATTALGLASPAAHVSKCLQLNSALTTRFGVIILGCAASGKTSLTKSLQNAHNLLAQQSAPATSPRVSVSSVSRAVINPKAYSLEDLYGTFEEATGEWSDGLLPAACRKAMTREMHDGQPSSDKPLAGHRTWVVLDGPIDSAWVENLNTVLDDSRRLCLASGERMILSEQNMNIILEAEDLTAASPATVSRCGMGVHSAAVGSLADFS